MTTDEAITWLENHISKCREIGRMLELKSAGLYRESNNEDAYEAIETLIKFCKEN